MYPYARINLLMLLFLMLFLLHMEKHVDAAPESDGSQPEMHIRAVRLGNRMTLMRDDGKIIADKYDGPCYDFSDGLFLCKYPNGHGEYLSPDGEIILRVNDKISYSFSEGFAAARASIPLGKWGYINKKNEWVIEPKFDRAGDFHEGVADVKIDNKYQYIDKSGKKINMPNLQNSIVWDLNHFRSGVALVNIFGGFGVIDHFGNWIIPVGRAHLADIVFRDGLAPQQTSDGKLGFVNTKGELAIPPVFINNFGANQFFSFFEEGLAAVYIMREGKNLAGFIDTKGDWIIPAKFEDARSFCNGLAPAKINGKWGYIDRGGSFVIPTKYEDAKVFRGGIAEVMFHDESGKLWRAYINSKNTILYRLEVDTSKIFDQL
jgi:hypothetical protein